MGRYFGFIQAPKTPESSTVSPVNPVNPVNLVMFPARNPPFHEATNRTQPHLNAPKRSQRELTGVNLS